MATFAVFGKYIVESAGRDILNECHIIKNGSLKSFISGKEYKISKRVHQQLALAIGILHFQWFLESNETTETSDIIERYIFNFEPMTAVIWIVWKGYTRFLKNMKNIKRKQRLEYNVKSRGTGLVT